MSNVQVVSIDPIRTVASTAVSGTYALIGTPLTHPVRLICFTNNTDGDLFFSTNASDNMLFVAAGGFKLFDLTTNRYSREQYWVFPVGTQFYVKQSTAPSKGNVFIECLWGE